MSKAIVHIGLPKTGTTSFQFAMQQAWGSLLEQGIRVMTYEGALDFMILPTMSIQVEVCVVRPDLDAWSRQVCPESVLPEFQAACQTSLRAAVDAPEPLLIASCENLSLIRTRDEVRRLRELFAPRELVVVFVRREKESYRRSLRRQVDYIGVRTWSPLESSCSNFSEDSWLFDHDALINVLVDELGKESVRVIDYDSTVASHGSIVPTLWSACELPSEVLSDELLSLPRQNQTPDLARDLLPPDLDSCEDLEYLRGLIIRQANTLNRVRTSRSWRYTRPLRLLRGNGQL